MTEKPEPAKGDVPDAEPLDAETLDEETLDHEPPAVEAAEPVPPPPAATGLVEGPLGPEPPAVVVVAANGEDGAPPSPPGPGPGARAVGVPGISVLVTLYFVLSILCIYGLLALWPTKAGMTAQPATTTATETTGQTEGGGDGEPSAGESAVEGTEAVPVEPPPKEVSLFGLGPWEFDIEILFFLIVGLSGAIGGSVAAVRSLGIYVGSRKLTMSWIPFYIFKPLLGALLAIVVYLLLRAGLFSPSASNAQVSPYGFAAIAALVGVFSEHAAEKLRRVAVEFFNDPYEKPPPENYADEVTGEKPS